MSSNNRKLQEALIERIGDLGSIGQDAFKLMRGVDGFYTDQGYARAAERYEKDAFNSVLRSVESEPGSPVYHYLEKQQEHKQIALFDLEDYKTAGEYRIKHAMRHITVLKALQKQCREQYRQSMPVQLNLLADEVARLATDILKPVEIVTPIRKRGRPRKQPIRYPELPAA